jgi:hypothetical protein
VSVVFACLVALAASLPTTLITLGVWTGYGRLVDGHATDTVFLALVFLFVPLIFFVSIASNLAAVLLGQLLALTVDDVAGWVTVALAGALVVLLCAWTQRGVGFGRISAPVSPLPVALFAAVNAVLLCAGLQLLPGDRLF